MIINITKGSDRDWLEVQRADGSTIKSTFPKKGNLPHDAIHYFVEQELRLTHGFWGFVGAGTEISNIQNIAKEAGHASAKRATAPDANIIELLQAERLVECFEAEQWSKMDDNTALRETMTVACEASHISPPDLSNEILDKVRAKIKSFSVQWTNAAVGETFQFDWK